MTTPGELQVASSPEHLDTTLVETGTKNSPTHREGVFIGDPATGGARANVETDSDLTNGRLAVIGYLQDRLGRQAKVSQKGELLTGTNIDDVNINFQYSIRTAKVKVIKTGTGQESHPGVNGSYAEISPGTGVGSCEIRSKMPVRYRGGHEAFCELSHIFATPESTNWAEQCGFLNDSDRFTVGYQDDVFGAYFREGGNTTFKPASEFNFDKLDGTGPSGMTLIPQNINVYRLSYVWHGGLPLAIEVAYKQQWWPVHVFDFSNQIQETHLENPHLPVGIRIERTAGSGTAITGKAGSWRGGSIAGSVEEPSDDWTAWTRLSAAVTASARNNLFTITNVSTWQGKENHIVYELGVVTFDSELNKTSAVYGTVNGTVSSATNGPAYIDETNHPLQYLEGGIVNSGTGSRGPATVIKGGGDRRTDVRGTGIFVFPGDSFTFEWVPAAGAAAGNASISARFRALQ